MLSADLVTDAHIKELVENGSVVVPCARVGGIPEILNGFSEFCSKPAEFREQFIMGEEVEKSFYDVGLYDGTLKEIGNKDQKQWMHFTPEYTREMVGKYITNCHFDVKFFQNCGRFSQGAQDFARSIVKKVGERIAAGSDFYEAFEKADDLDAHRLRALLYLITKERKPARKHSDRSGLTVHISGSGPLKVWRNDGTSFIYESADDHVLIFFGDKASLVTGGELVQGAVTDDHEKKEIAGGMLHASPHQPLNDSKAKGNRKALVYFYAAYLECPENIDPLYWYSMPENEGMSV